MVTYGLPSRGQRDWDDEVNNSVEYLHSQAQAATAAAEQARSNATSAIAIAQEAASRINTVTETAVALDTDGIPYVTGAVFAGAPIEFDTDDIPYLSIGA